MSMHPGAYADHLSRALPITRAQRPWTAGDGPLPALYFGHGAPPLLDDPLWLQQLLDWVTTMPKPRAVLVVSAHWQQSPATLSATTAGTPLVYDFTGFAQRFYELTYPTPAAGDLAAQVTALMPDSSPVHQHPSRGLDHGAWVPMMAMFPLGDVPVLQLSLPTDDPGQLMELGRRLRPLREEGVLLLGSGFLTHGLPFLTRDHWANREGTPAPGWSTDFDAWAGEALDRADLDTLCRYRSAAPGMPYAHPTVEHYVPLFVTLAAATDTAVPPTTMIDGFWMGLSKRSFQVN